MILGNTARQEQAVLFVQNMEKQRVVEGGDMLGNILANLLKRTEDLGA